MSEGASVVHPINRAWLSTGGTGAQNYDEFADEAEITAIVAANPASALGVEMPHRTPEAVAAGLSFSDALPAAAARLAGLKTAGRFRPADDVVAVYRTSAGDTVGYGLFCMVDTDQISTSADEPGLVIRNEDVFIEKVRERTALADTLGHLVSPVLLLQTGRGDELSDALAALADRLGEPATTDVDPQGREHAIWPVPAGPDQRRLLDLAGGGELIVADGNHRTLAAQLGRLPRFLAVVCAPGSVHIQPYNRLVSELPVPADELVERLRSAGAEVRPAAPELPSEAGTIRLYTREGGWEVRLPHPAGSARVDDGRLDSGVVDRLDHSLVERLVLGDTLGLDAGDKRITYVGGDYPARWLTGEVDAGRADLAILIAAVTVDDFVAVNLARLKMPRKSTWFTPKARAGLVLADLSAGADGAASESGAAGSGARS